MTTTVEDLEQAMYKALERNGVLAKLKSTLRAEIFDAMDDKDLPPPPEEPEDTELANEIIREYLRWHDYRGTLSVFESETGRKENEQEEGLSRDTMNEILGIRETDRTKRLPLLYLALSLLKENNGTQGESSDRAAEKPKNDMPSDSPTKKRGGGVVSAKYEGEHAKSSSSSISKSRHAPKFEEIAYPPVVHNKGGTRVSPNRGNSSCQRVNFSETKAGTMPSSTSHDTSSTNYMSRAGVGSSSAATQSSRPVPAQHSMQPTRQHPIGTVVQTSDDANALSQLLQTAEKNSLLDQHLRQEDSNEAEEVSDGD